MFSTSKTPNFSVTFPLFYWLARYLYTSSSKAPYLFQQNVFLSARNYEILGRTWPSFSLNETSSKARIFKQPTKVTANTPDDVIQFCPMVYANEDPFVLAGSTLNIKAVILFECLEI